MDIAAGGERFSVLLNPTGVRADHGVADSDESGKIELHEERALVEGFVDKAFHPFLSEGFGIEAV